jgi:hypothetical protein
MYRVDDQRQFNTHRGALYRPQELQEAGLKRLPIVGLADATLRHLADAGYEADEADEVPPRRAAVMAHGAAARPDPELGVTIRARAYARAGFVGCALLALGLGAATLAVTAPWCGRRIAAFERLLTGAVALDVLLVQPAYVLCLWLWRWMVSEEADGHAVHELHPIDGQWRVVGAWDTDADDEPADEAALHVVKSAAADAPFVAVAAVGAWAGEADATDDLDEL